MHFRAVDFYGRSIDEPDLRAHVGQDGQEHIGVADLGHVFYAADAVYHQGRGDDCHRRVLRAADLHFAVQHSAAFYHVFFQELHLPTM